MEEGYIMRSALLLLVLGLSVQAGWGDPLPPESPVKLIFIHHSTGENWLADGNGGLGLALRENNYFTSDTNYGWGPDSIGDHTDIGHWWLWFRGPDSARYLEALYDEGGQHSYYSRLPEDPGGENSIVLFKSCFPNSALKGGLNDPILPIEENPLRGEDCWSPHHTLANAKGIYSDLLEYFKTRPDKLFIVITAPPLSDPTYSANARELNRWLVEDWLDGNDCSNVFVFDFFNVLTSNGGSPAVNDLGMGEGNHHRWWDGSIQHQVEVPCNTLAYPSGDDHPSQAGNLKATGEFLPLLNLAYGRWMDARRSWTGLGGWTQERPAMIRDGDGEVHVFAIGLDRALWDYYMGEWHSLGGVLTSPPWPIWNESCIHVFARGEDGGLWDRVVCGEAGLGGSWHGLGGYLTGGVTGEADSLDPNLIRLVARDGGGALWMMVVDSTDLSGKWQFLGGVSSSAPFLIGDAIGRVHILVQGLDGGLWDCVIDGLGGVDWVSPGGRITSGVSALKGPDGSLDIFVRGEDGHLWIYRMDAGLAGSWHDGGGYILPVEGGYSATPEVARDGRVFLRGGDGNLWEGLVPGGEEWRYLGGQMTTDPCALGREVSIAGAGGDLWLFAAPD